MVWERRFGLAAVILQLSALNLLDTSILLLLSDLKVVDTNLLPDRYEMDW